MGGGTGGWWCLQTVGPSNGGSVFLESFRKLDKFRQEQFICDTQLMEIAQALVQGTTPSVCAVINNRNRHSKAAITVALPQQHILCCVVVRGGGAAEVKKGQ